MNANIFRLTLATLVALHFMQCSHDPQTDQSASLLIPPQDAIPNQYIIMLKSEFMSGYQPIQGTNNSRADKGVISDHRKKEFINRVNILLSSHGIPPANVFSYYHEIFLGFSIQADKEQLKTLLRLADVSQIEQDMMVSLPDFTIESIDRGYRAQTVPCGITNAGGSADGSGSQLWIWITDTGIDLDHPDLNVETNPTYAKSYIPGSSNPDDCHGHGTHCAGIAAAIDNSIGVIGVSAGAKVVPVRVLDCNGSGATSWILNGLNHIATYDEPGDVVNMSLGGLWGRNCATQSSYVTALTNLSNAGTRSSLAAGNNSKPAKDYTPACINATNIHTIASMTCSKAWSSFSNSGIPPIDWIATGSSVYSTYKNGGYATMSGTSMAAPHVAGIMHNRNNSPLQNGTVVKSGVTYKIAVRQ